MPDLAPCDNPDSGLLARRALGTPCSWNVVVGLFRHCEKPTGRANARPMTGSATKRSSFFRAALDCVAEPVIRRRFAPTRRLAVTHVGEKRDNMISEESNDV